MIGSGLGRAGRWALLVSVLVAVGCTAAGCADELGQAPAEFTRRLDLEPVPLEYPSDRGAPSGRMTAERQVRIDERFEQEREWCRDAVGEVEPLGEYELIEWSEPASADELAWMQVVSRETVKRRGLELLQKPPVYVLEPEAFRRALCALLLAHDESEAPDPQWHLDLLLGNIAPSWNPSVLEYLRWMQAAGWYYPVEDGEGGQIVLAAERPLPREYVGVFSHELAHGLQDQHFGLAGHEREQIGSSDAASAYSWIYEGDATYSAIEFLTVSLDEAIRAVEWGPLAFGYRPITLYEVFPERAELTFAAYRAGSALIRVVFEEEGQEAVDRLLAERVESTTQVLHPSALLADLQPLDRAEICALTPALLDGASCEGPKTDRFGEAMLSTFIAEATGAREQAVAAADGWSGGLARVFELQRDDGSAALVVLWQIVFRDATEHAEGFAELRNWLVAHSGGQARAAVGGSVVAWDGPAGAVRLLDHARMVWLIAADDAFVADDVALSALEIDAEPDWWDRP